MREIESRGKNLFKNFGERKDPWTEPKGLRIEGRRWGWVGQGRAVAGKWRQLYLNNNKKKIYLKEYKKFKLLKRMSD